MKESWTAEANARQSAGPTAAFRDARFAALDDIGVTLDHWLGVLSMLRDRGIDPDADNGFALRLILLTETEVAGILRKSPSALSRMRREGTSPAWKYIGQTPMYRLDDLLDFLDRPDAGAGHG